MKTNCIYRSVEWYKNSVLGLKKQQSLSILHLNVRSIVKNKHNLEELLNELSYCPDVLPISETKLSNDKVSVATIKNYNVVFSNSSSNAGG